MKSMLRDAERVVYAVYENKPLHVIHNFSTCVIWSRYVCCGGFYVNSVYLIGFFIQNTSFSDNRFPWPVQFNGTYVCVLMIEFDSPRKNIILLLPTDWYHVGLENNQANSWETQWSRTSLTNIVLRSLKAEVMKSVLWMSNYVE